MIRRRKKEVAKQLPPRIDKNLLVPMTAQQTALHNGYSNDLAQLVAKWRRHGFLSEKDRQRLMIFLMMMRMSCNSTFLVDQKTRHDTKIDELFYLLEERLADREEKVVIFSQWERMTRIVAKELEERGIEFANLHGGVPSKKRGALLERFREDDDCRIFLSTDAGGVGLNLQRASLVINLDLPWNPAILEQRIARVHRLGQTRGVQVINLISEGTIEHRMVHTLRFKSSLAEAVLDTAVDSVFMSDRKFGSFMAEPGKSPGRPTCQLRRASAFRRCRPGNAPRAWSNIFRGASRSARGRTAAPGCPRPGKPYSRRARSARWPALSANQPGTRPTLSCRP